MKLPAAPEVLLLDAGNTLIFLDEEAVAQTLVDVGLNIAPPVIREALGPAKREYERRLAEGTDHEVGWFIHMEAVVVTAGAPADRVQPAVEALRRSHDELNLWRRVPDGVHEALDRLLRSGIRLGVVSNSEGFVESVLHHVGLGSRFEIIVDSHHEGVCKPDPEIFRRALSRMDVGGLRALYVGDVPAVDISGARAAGLDAILIDPFAHYPGYEDAPTIRSVVELAEAWCGTS